MSRKIRGLSLQVLSFAEIREMNIAERVKRILHLILGNKIVIIHGRLRPEEEARLIEDTMAMIGHIKDFKGIELAVISGNGNQSIFDKFKKSIVTTLSGGDLAAITIIGPASIVKEMKRNPKKIELMLNK